MKKYLKSSLYGFFGLALSLVPVKSAIAQSITPATDGTGTIINSDGTQFNIQGGSLSGDGANLFHSFQQFGLNPQQIANFLSNPEIRNILGRVVGGNPSIIQGLIRVTGSDANLFLMNPSGFIFGQNARLDVSGSFFTTTATGIKIGDRWFSASGTNDYSALVGNPSAFAFTQLNSGAIINQGELSVTEGNTLGLIGGTVISTGTLTAPEGNVVVTAVAGQNVVNLSIPGNVLSLEVKTTALGRNQPNQWNLPITALPVLLTMGQVNLEQAENLSSGDAAIQQLAAGNGVIWAKGNLNLVESQLTTTGDLTLLADDTLFVRDSQNNSFMAESGGDLVLRGNQSIDILALNNPNPSLVSGGNLTLISDGEISGDTHYSSQGNVAFLTLEGKPANFVSKEDPIITAIGDVTFGDYTGAALKVEATGSIEGGNIRITSPDINLSGSDPDIEILTSSPALILRAGLQLSDLQNRPNDPQSVGNTQFNSSRSFNTTGGFISVGSIDTSSTSGVGGLVILSALGTDGSITVNGNINTFSAIDDGGRVELTANGGNSTINVQGEINTSSAVGNGGLITLSTVNGVGDITIEGTLNTSATGENSGQGGPISIDARGTGANITLDQIDTFSASSDGGAVNLTTFGNSSNITVNNGIITESNRGNGGTVNLLAQGNNGNIEISEGIFTSSFSNGQGGDIFLNTDGNIGKVTVNGDIVASSLSLSSQRGGNINSVALGNAASITVNGNITTRSEGENGGNIKLETQGQNNPDGKIFVGGDLNTTSSGRDGGNITVAASGSETAEASIFIGGEINSSSSASPVILSTEGQFIIIDFSQTGNGGNVSLEALGDIEVGRINTQGSDAFNFNPDGNIFIGQRLDVNRRIANGGNLTINTLGTLRVFSQFESSELNIGFTNENFPVPNSPVSANITTQGANNVDARGGAIDLRIGQDETFTTPGPVTNVITNSPVTDANFLGQPADEIENSESRRGFFLISEGGGFPFDNQDIQGTPQPDFPGTTPPSGSGGGVGNAIPGGTLIGNNTASDTASRQNPTVIPDNNNPNPTAPQSEVNGQQMVMVNSLEEEDEKLDNPCQNPEEFRNDIIKNEDPNLEERLPRNNEQQCQDEEKQEEKAENNQNTSIIEEENNE